MDATYRQAELADIAAIAAIYIAAFPASIEHFAGLAVHDPHGPRWAGPRALLEDLLVLWLRADGQAFIVAELSSPPAGAHGLARTHSAGTRALAGYVFAPSDIGAVIKRVVRDGQAWRMAGRLLSGRYGIGTRLWGILLRNAGHLLADRLGLVLAPAGPRRVLAGCVARIMSIAVAPEAQGRGIGRQLMARALERQRRLGVRCVRLEVRPDNAAALRLYAGLGFRPVMSTRDSQGPWLVMTTDL